jgi:hypothetical protein
MAGFGVDYVVDGGTLNNTRLSINEGDGRAGAM